MAKMDELRIIAEADVVLSFSSQLKEGVSTYWMTNSLKTPLGEIGISFDVIMLDKALGYDYCYDLNVWYPKLYVDGSPLSSCSTSEDSKTSAMFFGGLRLKPRKSIIYYAEESEDTYNKVRYKWVWTIPVRYYDEGSGRYVADSHIAVLVADLRFGLPEYNNRAVPVLHVKLYEPVSINSLRDTDS